MRSVNNHGTIGIWTIFSRSVPNRSAFTVPITIKNNFTGGVIKFNNSVYNSPYSTAITLLGNYSYAAISLQNEETVIYRFRQWSDNNTNLNRTLTDDGQHYSYSFTASFWNAYMTGPGVLDENELGNFNAYPANGTPPYNFTWYKMQLCASSEEKSGAEPDGLPCNVWIQLSQFNGSTTATTSGLEPGFKMKVKVTDTWGENYKIEVERTIFIGDPTKKFLPELATEGNIPMDFTLFPAYPNPFNPQTTLRYALPEASPVILVIYNLNGGAIKTLIQTPQPAGVHSVSWNGTDYQGKIVPAGIYLCQLQAIGTTQKFSQTQKLSLIK